LTLPSSPTIWIGAITSPTAVARPSDDGVRWIRAKYGYDVAGGTIGITAARSPVFAWHDPEVLDQETAGK